MKTTSIKLSALCLLFSATLITACGTTGKNETDTTNVEGNNNKMDENSGNHANTPNNAPGTEYPGTAVETSVNAQDTTARSNMQSNH